MNSLRQDSHAFVVRIWQEPREIEGATPLWRGSVENVHTGERRYARDLGEIGGLILLYLEAASPKPEGPS